MPEVQVTARLNDRCQPEFRGGLFEDPLNAALEMAGRGSVSGGGTQLGPTGEVAFCEIEATLSGDDEAHFNFVISELNRLGAPKGSELVMGRDRSIPFGVTEGMGIYLNGTDLPREVYEQSDVNVVIEELLKALGDEGKLHGYWEGGRETALYFYGTSFDEMRGRTSSFLQSYPLCQRARVEKIA